LGLYLRLSLQQMKDREFERSIQTVRHFILHPSTFILAMAALLAPAIALSQQYPTKPIRLVVPLAPGGNLDIVARALAQTMSESLKQSVVVENRPGASSLVGTQAVAKSAADGYTLLAIANTFATVPSLMANAGYDPLKDFTGVSLTCLVPMVMVVTPTLPVRTVKDLVQLAKVLSKRGFVVLVFGCFHSFSDHHYSALANSVLTVIKIYRILT
jgi:tripartite-type tricarboxylate transporter receptor subunit TctC